MSEGGIDPRVGEALEDPQPGERGAVLLDGHPFSYLAWGETDRPAVLLVHGARGSARVWWRVGPALAASGRRVVAVDLPGHGHTPSDPSLAPLEALARAISHLPAALGLASPVDVVGTSWGAMVASRLATVGMVPRNLVVVEPPVVGPAPPTALAAQLQERPGPTPEETRRRVDSWHPDWDPRDRAVKAESLHALDMAMLEAVMSSNPPFDGGRDALARSQELGTRVWVVRGSPDRGGLTPDDFIASVSGFVDPERIFHIPGAGHVPQRTHPRELVTVCLRALG